MSMKRTKQSRSFSRDSSENDSFSKPQEPEPSWDEVASKPDADFLPYAMSSKFPKGALIQHSKFGKGIVLASEAASIVVLFQEGKKKLGHAMA